ncbi:MAG: flagellar filament capping protein FliD [Gammaproteobacteria bacterium]|nr:flagellar hook protein [Sideroxydans sp.]MBU3904425.1 flagellar filament capping protein FliD [Gammaproteobacteria bacterium]MBU4046408.1 flagellar filament capping protein FliD [Gammaproteobacteria bacterium]MBU4150871.1 flagellar filament capping protein FliD [Gammaproteobacteria bacterium]
MAISSATSGSSIDVDAIVSGLMSIERQPIDKLNSKETSYQAKITALGSIKSKVANLQTAAQALGSSSSSSLSAFNASSSDTSVLSAAASSTAVAGTYSLAVTSLAQSQKLVAAGQTSSTAAIGSGTSTVVTFDFGTISGGTLTNGVYTGASFTSGGTTANITIDSSNNTLQGIRDAINAANMGVSATIVNDGSGTPYRLALSSNATGVTNSIKISTDGADASIDSLLAHNPAGTQKLTETVSAQNAAFSVNGIAVTKTSNTVTDVVEGVTLTLNKAASSATLTVGRDTAAVSKSVTDFVTAYNELYTAMKNSFAYKSGSALAGDSTLRTLQTEMRQIIATATGSGSLNNLFEIGVSSKSDGTLKVDSEQLSSAMSANFSDVASLFNSTTGFATRLDQWSTSALALDGTFANRTSNLNQTLKYIATQRDTLETRMASVEKNYRRQFSSLNVALAGLNMTSSYLTQQLGKL